MGCSCSCSWPLLTALCASAARAFGESQAPRPYLSDAACICISTEFPKSFTSRQLAKQRTNMWLSRSLKTAPRLELSRGGAPPGADAAGAAGAATATPSKASAGGAGGRTSEPGARTFGGGVAAVRSAPGSAAGSMGGAAAAGAAGPAGGSGAVAEVVEARPTRVPFRWVQTDPQSLVLSCYVCSPASRFLAQRSSRRLPWHRSQPKSNIPCPGFHVQVAPGSPVHVVHVST